MEYLHRVTSRWKEEVQTGRLDRWDSWDDFILHVLKTVEYSLLVTNFKHQECQKILQLALEGRLNALGVFRNMNQVIVHAQLCFQGLGIPSLYISQGIAHIEALLNAPPLEGMTGRLFTCSVEDLKLEVGLLGYFLQHNYKYFKWVTSQCWWMSTWEFVCTGWIQVKDVLQDLPLSQINDEHLCFFRQPPWWT